MPTADGQLTAGELAQIVALVQAQAAVRQQLARTAVAGALTAFAALTSWWHAAQISMAITQALRIVQPTQLQAARITDAYLARVLSVLTGRTGRPAGAVDITRLRRAVLAGPTRLGESGRLVGGSSGQADRDLPGLVLPQRAPGGQLRADEVIDPAQVYGRIADWYRYQVTARGVSEEHAQRAALTRVRIAAETDVTLAVREQVRRTLFRSNVRGYRRIPRPELSRTGPCGLCVVDAGRVYTVEELLPIHNRCVCEVLPILGTLDPGLRLNRDDLKRLYEAAGGTGAAGLLNVQVEYGEHGELGPVLSNAKHRRRGPHEVAAAMDPDLPRRRRVQLRGAGTAAQQASGSRKLRREHHLRRQLAPPEDRRAAPRTGRRRIAGTHAPTCTRSPHPRTDRGSVPYR